MPEGDCTRLLVEARISDITDVSTGKIAWRRSLQDAKVGVVADTLPVEIALLIMSQSKSHVVLRPAFFGWKV